MLILPLPIHTYPDKKTYMYLLFLSTYCMNNRTQTRHLLLHFRRAFAMQWDTGLSDGVCIRGGKNWYWQSLLLTKSTIMFISLSVCQTCCVLFLLCISQRPKELISRKQSRGIKPKVAHAFLSLVTSASRNQMAGTYIPLSVKIAPLGVSRAVHVRRVLCSLHLGYGSSWESGINHPLFALIQFVFHSRPTCSQPLTINRRT